jgi:hypothetical protein
MTQATQFWSIWQALLNAFARALTARGFRRFVAWITAMTLNVEEHSVTQSVLALDRPDSLPRRLDLAYRSIDQND